MKEAALVSVIIPAYNAEKYVESAVRSIMTQTYKNLEILVTDDCSTDSTLEILNSLTKEDCRIVVYHNEQNKGIVKTLNDLVSRANGKYIARMDADDISLPKRIEKQVKFLEKHPKYVFCGTNAIHIDENGMKIGKTFLPKSFKEINRTKYERSPFYHPCICIQSSILKQNRYDVDYQKIEDYDLWLRLLKNYKGCNLSKNYFLYRRHSSSISSTFSEEILQKLISLFKREFCCDYNTASAYVNCFYRTPQICNNEGVRKIVLHSFLQANIFSNIANGYKEILFFKKNSVIWFIFLKPFTILSYFIRIPFCYIWSKI